MGAKMSPLLHSYYHKDLVGKGTWLNSLGKCDFQADTGAGQVNAVSWLPFQHGAAPSCIRFMHEKSRIELLISVGNLLPRGRC